MAELSGLCQELGSALLLISHDLAMAARWCDRMAMLDGGRNVRTAQPSTSHPAAVACGATAGGLRPGQGRGTLTSTS